MHISLAAEKIFTLFGLPVTNTLIMAWVAMGVLVIGSLLALGRPEFVPRRAAQNFVEAVIEASLGFVESVVGSRKEAERFFPIVATVFFFILVANWLGIFPGVGSIGFSAAGEHGSDFLPLLRSMNSDINMTLALAIAAVVTVQVFGIVTLGVLRYGRKYINFSNPILFFVGILEAVSELAKAVSFSFRLFGNIFAGEVLLTVIAFLVPFLAPLPFLGLEIFVGFMQALVFAMLTLVFLKVATLEAHH